MVNIQYSALLPCITVKICMHLLRCALFQKEGNELPLRCAVCTACTISILQVNSLNSNDVTVFSDLWWSNKPVKGVRSPTCFEPYSSSVISSQLSMRVFSGFCCYLQSFWLSLLLIHLARALQVLLHL